MGCGHTAAKIPEVVEADLVDDDAADVFGSHAGLCEELGLEPLSTIPLRAHSMLDAGVASERGSMKKNGFVP